MTSTLRFSNISIDHNDRWIQKYILWFHFSCNEYGPHFEVDSWPSKARKAKINISHKIFLTAASLNILHCVTKYFYLVPVRLSARWIALVIMVCMLARWAEQLGGGASPADTERWTLRAPGPSHTTLGEDSKYQPRFWANKQHFLPEKLFDLYH